MKALFLGISKDAEQELIDDGVDTEYLRQLAQHEGEVCDAHLSIMVNEDEWEENYYDLFFADGFRFYECSGFHLEEVK